MKSRIIIALSAVLLMILASSVAHADSVKQIQGRVINPEGNPVAGAIVEIIETGNRIQTDSRGMFTFQLHLHGDLTLRTYTDKYVEVFSQTMDCNQAAQDTITLQFTERRSFGETIVITGTRQETLLKDTPVRTEVISSELIEQRQSTTLADAIDGLSGLRVENNCQNCGFNQLRINGLEGGYSRITVDGLNAFSSMSGVYGLEQIPSVIVDRIEVVKGGGSVLYGAGAVGGVVNVITKEPASTAAQLQTSMANMDGVFAGTARGYGSWVRHGGGLSFFAYGSLDKASEYDRDGDGFTELGRKQMESGGARFFLTTLENSAELKLGLDASHEWRRGGNDLHKNPEETLTTEFAESTRITATGDWNHFISDSTYYQVQFSHSENARDTYYGANFDTLAWGETDNPHSTLTGTVFHMMANHNISLGGQYERDSIDDYHPGYGHRTQQDYDNYGVFAQDDIAISSGLTMLVGIRFDEHSALENTVFSPRLSLMYEINEHFRLRTSYASGFKAPVVFDEDLHITIASGDPTFIVNADDLLEETIDSYSVSLEYNDSFSSGAGVRFEVNSFYSELEGTFVLDEMESERSNFFVRRNGGSSRVYGLEFTTDVSYGRYTVNGSFTAQRTELDTPDPDFGSTRFFKAPDYYGNLNVIYAGDNWTLGGSYTYTGPMLVPHFAGYIEADVLEESAEFHVFDLRVEVPLLARGIPGSLVFMAKNITDSFQEDFDKGVDRDAGYIYGPRTPRSFSMGLRLNF